jgi:adenine-specific DNA-methyltransferase
LSSDRYTLHLGDCRDVMRGMAPASVDAIVTDPPYHKVLDEEWDWDHDTADDFLAWMGLLCDDWRRILKPNGSLFVFCSPQMSDRVSVVIRERFTVLNQIVWNKPNAIAAKACKESLRSWFDDSERAIFAGHYGADNTALGLSTYAAKCDEARGFVFEPLRAYLAGEMERAGWTIGKVDQQWMALRNCKGHMAGHWFTRSQWALPTARHYQWLRELFNGGDGAGESLRRDYEELRKHYEELRKHYEELRRPFNMTAARPFRAVWEYAPVGPRERVHPCEKPQAMLRDILTAITKPGAVVLDCFAGSGSLGLAALDLGRIPVLIERDPEYAGIIRARLSNCLRPRLNEAPIEHLDLFDNEVAS